MPTEIKQSALTPTHRLLLEPFNEHEIRRLYWLWATVCAERHLVPTDQPCPDHTACRRLAFVLWLRCTDRLSETNGSQITNEEGETHA